MKSFTTDIAIIGGGAAGYFAAINLAESNSAIQILILEKSKHVLSKVKISGGGRCNVTHAEFDPKTLASNYPRGHKELLGPFHRFMTGDMMAWLEERGVKLKIEEDQRVFPVSESSQTIIDCFLNEAERLGVEIKTNAGIDTIQKLDNHCYSWKLQGKDFQVLAKKLIIASGSSPKMWRLIENLGHKVVSPVPSLFTFNVKDPRIDKLSGISVNAEVEVFTTKDRGVSKSQLKSLNSSGPLLITHWGMSGPCILKLSAWGARVFYELNHQFQLKVNWWPEHNVESLITFFAESKLTMPRQKVYNTSVEVLPKRLWQNLVAYADIDKDLNWSSLSKSDLQELAEVVCASTFHVNGKSTFKDEFVTAGGVYLKEIDFKTFQSQRHENLYFIGEVIDIDAVTGGFNFQNAWTSAFVCAQGIKDEK